MRSTTYQRVFKEAMQERTQREIAYHTGVSQPVVTDLGSSSNGPKTTVRKSEKYSLALQAA